MSATPQTVTVQFPARGTLASGEAATYVQWWAHLYEDGSVLTKAVAYADSRNNETVWDDFESGDDYDSAPEWVPPAPEWFRQAVAMMKESNR